MKLFAFNLVFLLLVAYTQELQASLTENFDKGTVNGFIKKPLIFQNLEGKYQGKYRGDFIEVWIENISPLYEHREDIAQNKVNEFAVLVFEQNTLSQVEEFLKKYQGDYFELFIDTCKYTKRPYPKRMGSYSIWDKLGSLAFIAVPDNLKTRKRLKVIRLEYFMYFKQNDEHLLQFVSIDPTGKALSLHFLETGFIKKPWNYFFSGPTIELEKISNNISGLLLDYTKNINIADGSFRKARENDIEACSRYGFN